MGEIRSGERVIDSAALMARAASAASGLSAMGVRPGDTVALLLRNDFAFLEATIAAGLIGAYPAPINWHATQEEARYLFEDSTPKVIVGHADLLAGVRGAINDTPVIVVPAPPEILTAYGVPPETAAIPPGSLVWDEWLASFAGGSLVRRNAPGSIIYTSGTTGRPKGVRRPAPDPAQAAQLDAILSRGFGFAPYRETPENMTVAIVGPMYHSAPNAYGLLGARMGANVVLQPRFDAEGLLRLIEARGVTHIHMAPIMFNRLLKLAPDMRTRYDLSSLRYIIHAAAPVAAPVKRAMIDWWGPIIHESYGSTETGMLAFCNSEEWLAHPGTVGRAIPEATLRIVGPDGAFLASMAVGEIVGRVAGTADFTYHGDEAARRGSERGGLIAPGDIGYLDEDGYLFLCDRAKDMVISGGVNIYPVEIEGELQRLEGVADCAVFGVPDEEFGESLLAVVQLSPGQALTEAQIRDDLRGRLSGYKIPRRILFADNLPREDSGKIIKRKLRDPYWAGLDRRIN